MRLLKTPFGLPLWALLGLGAAAVWLLSRRSNSLGATPIPLTAPTSSAAAYGYPYGYYGQQPQPWLPPEARTWGGRTFSSEPEDVQIVGSIR